jgi:hypothetical protein
MPAHEFKSQDGDILTKNFSIKEDVPVEIEENGKIYKRKFGFQGFRLK